MTFTSRDNRVPKSRGAGKTAIFGPPFLAGAWSAVSLLAWASAVSMVPVVDGRDSSFKMCQGLDLYCSQLPQRVQPSGQVPECVSMRGISYQAPPLLPGASNLQSTLAECCRSCGSNPACGIWIYCEQTGGCSAHNQSLPYRACELLPAQATLVREEDPIKAWLPFRAGVPLRVLVKPVPGYRALPGVGGARMLAFLCEGATGPNCTFDGTVEEFAGMCSKEPDCVAFKLQYRLPANATGKSTTPEDAPVGVLLGGPGVVSVPLRALRVDPLRVLYIKSSIPYEAATVGGADPDGSGFSPLTITLAVALPVAALAVGCALVAAVVLSRRDRQLCAAEATLRRLLESPACSSLGGGSGATPPGSLPLPPPAAAAKPGSPPGPILAPQVSGASHASSAAAGSLNELLAHVEQLAAAAAAGGGRGAPPLSQ